MRLARAHAQAQAVAYPVGAGNLPVPFLCINAGTNACKEPAWHGMSLARMVSRALVAQKGRGTGATTALICAVQLVCNKFDALRLHMKTAAPVQSGQQHMSWWAARR